GAPVLFASTGEKLGDFERFHPDRMASRILDMGDMLTLIEQAEKAFDSDQAADIANKIAGDGELTLEDFLQQMQQMKKLGPMKKMLEMLPGMGQMREELENFDESEVTRIEAMVQSMTPAERTNPKIINGSRRSRIARGSGTTVGEINGLLERFEQAKTMMRSMARGGGGMRGMGGLPGMGAMPGTGKKSKGRMAPPKKKKGKSGNPAKRAQQEREAAERAAQAAKAPSGSSFGLAEKENVDPASLNLPAGFEKFLGR